MSRFEDKWAILRHNIHRVRGENAIKADRLRAVGGAGGVFTRSSEVMTPSLSDSQPKEDSVLNPDVDRTVKRS